MPYHKEIKTTAMAGLNKKDYQRSLRSDPIGKRHDSGIADHRLCLSESLKRQLAEKITPVFNPFDLGFEDSCNRYLSIKSNHWANKFSKHNRLFKKQFLMQQSSKQVKQKGGKNDDKSTVN